MAKVLGRDRGSAGGVGYAAVRTGAGETVAAVAAVNAAGDVIDEDGSVLAGPRDDEGKMVRGAEALVAMERAPEFKAPEGNTTLVCICTDAALSKREWMVARAATAGIARAVDPTFTPVDGDVASASPPAPASSARSARCGRRRRRHGHRRRDPRRSPAGKPVRPSG